ncbi:acetate/propionate family kinase [Nocardioides sp. YIM 152315]|uniref:acetate/propionate family kinase n=1 Tax=Nocardioides sp. YIM 152315 TaxID=3031760 RepID=UPI0023DB60DD|nr:acetate/propionate family kinase [Nocardioides sp. YIM 152315]MDF1603978.1 acetate/propionate family kinase [Nocardioides sp. YIM 152315]
MRTLVVNPGSSSLKVSLLDDGREVPDDGGPYDAVGVRFVHGGTRTSAVLVTREVLEELAEVSELAPLHNPPALEAARDLTSEHPDTPVVACFDTTFHATIPAAAATYALPREWREAWGLRRYGFHGLSHAYAARTSAEMLRRPVEELRIVTCHLGGGASLCAVRGGRSVDTTMGLTPMEGLVMQTRSGSIDPGLMLHVMRSRGVSAEELERVLEHESGLRGLTGTSGDLREVRAAIEAGSDAAAAGIEVYVHRLVREIGAMAAATGGVDALVFTGGVGEHAPDVRLATVARLDFLGLAIDELLNDEVADDADVSASGAGASTLVVAAREDLEIEREVRAVVSGAGRS